MFIYRVTWKAFWARRRVALLMSLFLGLAIGLVWLSWDTDRAHRGYMNWLWQAVGTPFYVRNLQADPARWSDDVHGPIPLSLWAQVERQFSVEGEAVPWIERTTWVDGREVRWVVTDVRRLPFLRPWIRLSSPDEHVWLNGQRPELQDLWPRLCQFWGACEESLGEWTTAHDPLDVLIDWTWWQKRHPTDTVDWIEGRWKGSAEAYTQWRQAVEAQFGVVVLSDYPAMNRFQTVVRLTEQFLRLSGWGLTTVALLTLLQVMLFDVQHRRREWAIWMTLGAYTRSFLAHLAGLAVCWSLFVFVAVNLAYWAGRVVLHWVLPELPITPAIWEGPLIALLIGGLCSLGMLPALRETLRLRPADWLRNE
ncbi:MAG: ABC transporter permease [Acidobacteria bacterium]|nr:ABC transporter permease [Acidobacteriota bacterium]MDW7985148.1 ABC transporter permease [Acidobacteriota bacterium]